MIYCDLFDCISFAGEYGVKLCCHRIYELCIYSLVVYRTDLDDDGLYTYLTRQNIDLKIARYKSEPSTEYSLI